MAKRKKQQREEPNVEGKIHLAKTQRFHLAQEFRDRGNIEDAENLTRGLLPHLRGRVQGLRDTHYVHPGFRSTKRRDIFNKAQEDAASGK